MRKPGRNLLAALLAICGAARAAGADFPYTAYVNSADVYVRSGPGRDYYPTDKLQKGERVEIYRHDPGGWYAIRPPRQSFSWISKRHLDAAEEGIGVVNTPRAVARVGSSFSDVREVIQVRLDKGEKVELLEPATAEVPWCKIAPPSGEFRWVFSKYVERDLPADLAADEREVKSARGFAGPNGSPTPEVRLASAQREGDSDADREIAPRARISRGSGDLSREALLEQELNRIELDLSAMVADDISAWSFGEFQRRAQDVLNASQTAIERGHARVLLNKLTRFDEIRERHEAVRRPADGAQRPEAAAGPADRRVDAARYDGVGRLSPVISEKAGGPQFALVDRTGAVVAFVTPSPGVNLRPFVDRFVGVHGQRGYMTDLQKQHINVQRVTVLEAERN